MTTSPKTMTYKIILSFFTLLLAFTSGLKAGMPPNILIVLVDDMGYSDLGCFGSEIITPNIDQLAANGLKFTQMYNTGKCYPTRASLQTGVYYQRTDLNFSKTATLGINMRNQTATATILRSICGTNGRGFVTGCYL